MRRYEIVHRKPAAGTTMKLYLTTMPIRAFSGLEALRVLLCRTPFVLDVGVFEAVDEDNRIAASVVVEDHEHAV